MVWVAVACVTVACATAPEVPRTANAEDTSMTEIPDLGTVDVNVAFRLSPGASVGLNDAQVTVGFVAVANDSRCPRDVQCMWEGDADVTVWLQVGEGTRREDVLRVNREPKMLEVDGYRLLLQGLEPYPVSTESIAAEDYVALLEVQR